LSAAHRVSLPPLCPSRAFRDARALVAPAPALPGPVAFQSLIARHAGVGQATLYRHFGDRAEIVATICHELPPRIKAPLLSAVRAHIEEALEIPLRNAR